MAPDEKVVVTLDNFEQRLMVTVLADFRNDLQKRSERVRK